MAKKKVKPSKDHISFFRQSLIDIKNNLVLFNIIFVQILFIILFGAFIVAEIVLLISTGLFSYSSFDSFIANISATQIVILIAVGIFDLLLLLVINAYIRSMLIGMCKEIIAKGTTNTKTMWVSSKLYFKNVFLTQFYIGLVFFLLPVIVLGGITLLIYLSSHTAGIIVGVLLLILFVLYLIFISILLIFIDPVLVDNNKNSAVFIIKKAVSCFSYNPGNVFVTWLVILVVSFIARLLIEPFMFLLKFMGVGVITPVIYLIILSIVFFIIVVISSLSGFVSELIIFRAYSKKR